MEGINFTSFASFILTVLTYIVLSVSVSAYFYYYKRRELFGGFLGGVIIAFIGTVIFSVLSPVIRAVINWLMLPGFAKVDLIAISLGAFTLVYIANKLNHDKKRDGF